MHRNRRSQPLVYPPLRPPVYPLWCTALLLPSVPTLGPRAASHRSSTRCAHPECTHHRDAWFRRGL